jgi:hypothetical protein
VTDAVFTEPKPHTGVEAFGDNLPWSTMPYLFFCLLLLICTDCVAVSTYEVSLDESLQHVDVRICFAPNDALRPADLHVDGDARAAISRLRWNEQRLDSVRQLRRLRVVDTAGNCLDYRAQLQTTGRSWFTGSTDYRLTSSKDWLLAPAHGQSALIRFHLPPGMAVSAPWPPAESEAAESADDWMLLGQTPPSWSNNVVFGRFQVQPLTLGNNTLRVAILPSTPALALAQVRPWLEASALAVMRVHGTLPQSDPQMLIIPVGGQNEAIACARVVRGGGIGVQFFVDPNRSVQAFAQDWKPTHEFSHLLFPYISRSDAWLSEGLASYYQNILRARDGRLSETEAWEKLLAGFERGRRDRKRNVTLTEEASGMRHNRSFMRVYWSGAAMMFLADTRLRELSGGQQSLDTALAGLASCCMQLGEVWRADAIMRKMDEFTGYSVFTDIYRQYAHSDQFPHVQAQLRDLGIVERHGRVRLDDTAPAAKLRHALLQFNQSTTAVLQ